MAKKFNDASIAIITSLNDGHYINTVNGSTGELDRITVANMKADFADSGVKIYATNLTQASTSAPTASTPINTTGATITFAYVSTGFYTATASSAIFTANKTFVFLTNVGDQVIVQAFLVSTTQIDIKTKNASTLVGENGDLNGNSFKIEIYP